MTRDPLITDWSLRDAVLPDVDAGAELEGTIAPQTFVVLHRIVVHALALVRLQIGAVEDVPFELESTNGPERCYKLVGLADPDLQTKLAAIGAVVAIRDAIAISPGLAVRVVLRNDGAGPAKPRAALIVQEEEVT